MRYLLSVLLLLSLSGCASLGLGSLFGPDCYVGLGFDYSHETMRINYVAPGSSAYKAKVEVGSNISKKTAWPPSGTEGEMFTLITEKDGKEKTYNLKQTEFCVPDDWHEQVEW